MQCPKPVETILVIEPDQDTAELYRRELARRFRVLTSPSATAGAAIADREEPCVIVLEPLGAEGGVGALQAALARTGVRQHTILVLCSVLDDRRLGETLGAACHLVKPVLPATLLAALERLCAERRSNGRAG